MSASNKNYFFQSGGGGSSSGSGGTGKNYLSIYKTSLGGGAFNTGNGDLELGATTGWSKGTTGTLTNGIPTGSPTFGSGASANQSIAMATTSTLGGAYSLDFISSTATTAGDMVSTDAFFIDAEDQAKVLGFKFAYNAQTNPTNGNFSGTSSNSFGVAAYDVTNSSWLAVAGQFNIVQSSGVGYATGTFQTNLTTASIRFMVYNVNASSGAITLRLDDFTVGPQVSAVAPAMTDWVTYTPTFSAGFGGPSAITFEYRRAGDSVFIRGRFTCGTTAASISGIGLPTGLSIDDAKIQSTIQRCGIASRLGTDNVFDLLALTGSSTTLGLGFGTTRATNTNVSTIIATGNTVTVDSGAIPVTGWSSVSVMSNDTDTRVIAAIASTASTQALTANVTDIIYGTLILDTSGSLNLSTGIYTCPVSGVYDVSLGFAGGATNTGIYKNGTLQFRSTPNAASAVAVGSGLIQCNAGDTLSARATNSVSLVSDANANRISIKRLSGPAVIAATESVNARYYASATSISGALATVVWTTKDFDSHLGMSSGIYTVPVSGKYLVNTQLAIAGTFALNNQTNLVIQKNSVTVSEVLDYAGGIITADHVDLDDIISCVAGDTLKVQLSSGATSPTIVSSNTKNFVSISRVGN